MEYERSDKNRKPSLKCNRFGCSVYVCETCSNILSIRGRDGKFEFWCEVHCKDMDKYGTK